jgi:hypothetical protein
VGARTDISVTQQGFLLQDLVGGDVRNDMTASPVLSLQMDYASPIKDVQTPLFSPAALPRPGRFVEEVWNARDVCRKLYITVFWLTVASIERPSTVLSCTS